MNLKLKNKKLKQSVFFITLTLTAICCLFISIQPSVFNDIDFIVLDACYRHIVQKEKGPKPSDFPEIKYVNITNQTYDYIQKNYLDRAFLAQLNHALTELEAGAIAYDILFPRPTNEKDDIAFAESIEKNQKVYMPIGMDLSNNPHRFEWKTNNAYNRLKTEYLKHPYQTGTGTPFYSTWALMQYEPFAAAAFNSGHISAWADHDGKFRHIPMVVKIDDKLFPSLPLAMFLDYHEVSFDKIKILWGNKIIVPALPDGSLEKQVVIPIDNRGLTFIPYHQPWSKGFEEIPAHVLVEAFKDPNLHGNLAEIIEGNFIFIGDVSYGISDLGDTPLENNAPLIITQASTLNGFLTQKFYSKWSLISCLFITLAIGLFLGGSAMAMHAWPLYSAMIIIFAGLAIVTGYEFIHFVLFPVATMAGITLFIAIGQMITAQIMIQKDRAFIKSVFSTYVPDKIVNHLLLNPELLTLGGDSREVTLMMTDIRGYTALSSRRTPHEVITILNRYFEKMFDIIMAHDGIVNEITGDGILAFFGAPEPIDDHPAKAVACAITMQNAMAPLNIGNQKDGLPALKMGIGINTGKVVVGNVGSTKRAQYGVTGSEVNLTARAESFTIGGQILVTGSVYNHLESVLTVNNKMSVGMKGFSKNIDLYDVVGIGASYNISLDQEKMPLVQLGMALKANLFLVDEKLISIQSIQIQIISISHTQAVLQVSRELFPLDNIRLHLFENNQCVEQAQIYAKVSSVDSTGPHWTACIDFTSVAPWAKKILASQVSF